MMKQAIFLQFLLGILVCFSVLFSNAEDPYRYYTWFVTYGTRAPLGVKQQALRKKLNSGLALPLPDGLLINGLHKASVFTGQKGFQHSGLLAIAYCPDLSRSLVHKTSQDFQVIEPSRSADPFGILLINMYPTTC
ncbi:hypothetical protein V6N13_127734 [Hibiscus sabdariffa]